MKFDDFTSVESPRCWRIDSTAVGSGRVLIGEVGDVSHLLAPPGVVAYRGEPSTSCAGWLHAVWDAGPAGEARLVDLEQPDRIRRLVTRAVVNLLPEESIEFVRDEMARQIGWWAAFGCRGGGAPKVEENARIAARAEAWLRSELEAAFPHERWYRWGAKVSSFEMPTTAEELLDRIPTLKSLAVLDIGAGSDIQEVVEDWPPEPSSSNSSASGTVQLSTELGCGRSKLRVV